MGLDIRLPIGGLFVALGLLLTLYGLSADNSIYQRSLGINVNLGWGIVLLTLGVLMIALAKWRSRETVRGEDATPEPSSKDRPRQA